MSIAPTTGAPKGLRLTVLGTGYLGATHAICMALLGHEVLGVDVDPSKVERLNAGEVPFFEPGLDEELRKALSSDRLRFTTDFAEAGAFGDIHFVCVGTPQQAGSYAADLTYIDSCIDSLAPYLSSPCMIVGKSTVPVGTAERLAARLQAAAPAGVEVHLAWNPEFLREGFAVEDTLHPDRLVFGVADPADEARLREVYAALLDEGTPAVVADLPTSELVKVAANSFLATKISFINAMAELCEAVDADVTKLQKALSYDSRIGGRFLQPGLGFGGGCLPKDIRAFTARAEELGVGQAVSFLREVDAINLRRRARTVDLIRELAGGDLGDRVVAVLGAAFKPDSDDVRDSPALDVAARLVGEGADVRVYDPKAMDNARRVRPDLRYVPSLRDAMVGAHVVAVLTEWGEFRALDPELVATLVATRAIFDGRHALDAENWVASGWTYRALGRRAQPAPLCVAAVVPIALVAVAVTGSACGASHAVNGAGAVGYRSPSVPNATVGPTAASADDTATPDIGGVPPARVRLVSGAEPAKSPVLRLRGTTWPTNRKGLPSVPLVVGGYEAETSIYPELNTTTRHPYSCLAAISLVTPSGVSLFHSRPQTGGTATATFVARVWTRAEIVVSGPVGCNWVLVLLPA